MGALARPAESLMRGGVMRRWKLIVPASLAAGVAGGLATYAIYMRPKWQAYQKHWDTYDPYKHLEAMCKKNLLQSCPKN